jgi:DNA-binding MarR family transcriptional regulator
MTTLTPQGDAFTQVVIELFRVNGRLLEAGDNLAQPVGLSSARWQVLGVVEHSPISVAHVARAMDLTRQSVQQTADGLEKDGFITFIDNPHHRRSRLMQLTPKGRAAMAYLQQQQAIWANALAAALPADDLAAAARALRRLHELLAGPATEANAPPAIDPLTS